MIPAKQPILIGGENHWKCLWCNSIKEEWKMVINKKYNPSYCKDCMKKYQKDYHSKPEPMLILNPEMERFIQLTIEELGL